MNSPDTKTDLESIHNRFVAVSIYKATRKIARICKQFKDQ